MCISLVVVAVTGFVLTIVGYIFMENILSVLGVREGLREPARNYLMTYMPVAIAAMGIYIPFFFLKINGAQRYSVVLFAVMAVCNISLVFLFVSVFSMGMQGVGLATTIANWVAFLPGVVLLFRKKQGGFIFTSVRNGGR